MIINVESQRIHGKCTSSLTDNNEVAAMMSNKSYKSNCNGGYNNNGGFNTNNYNGGFKRSNSFEKSGIYCEYYKGKGHTKDNCYKLHCYPPDFKNRKRESPSNTHANSVTSVGNQNQIFQLLNKGQEAEPVANVATAGTTGIAHALTSHLVDQNWIEDTSASNHMVQSLDLLDDYVKLTGKDRNKVHLFAGEQVAISHKGVASFFKDNPVQNILHIPDFKYNLLSVSKITKELQCLVAFYPDVCIFQELSSGKVLGIGKEEFGLYILKANGRPFLATEQSCSVSSLWHRRLGHAPLKVLQKLDGVPSLKLEGHHWILYSKRRYFLSNTSFESSILFPVLEFVETLTQSLPQDTIPDTTLVSAINSPEDPIFNSSEDQSTADVSPSPVDPSTLLPPGHSTPVVELIKSSRTTKPPVWLKDFVVQPQKGSQYPISNYVGYNTLSSTYQVSLAAYSAILEPKSFSEASRDPKWIDAMQSEIVALEKNNTWSVVDLPSRKTHIGCK
ncbi:uncharacterized protein LOC107785239 [Nicotiana tabacum]|uniref:Uncharacterized protein LOC107785239 n=1 Tax=Nicotiana tabacum TaxID=4097 RepID=A0AC58UC03_TOBAC